MFSVPVAMKPLTPLAAANAIATSHPSQCFPAGYAALLNPHLSGAQGEHGKQLLSQDVPRRPQASVGAQQPSIAKPGGRQPRGAGDLSVSPHQVGALLAHADVPLVMWGGNKRHRYCTCVRVGVNLLQLSPKVPTAQRPGSCRSYLLGCKKSIGTRVLLTTTEIQKRTTRQLENPHYQAQSLEPCKQHSPPQKPTRRRLPQNCCLCPCS